MRDADHGAHDLLEKSREIAKVTQADVVATVVLLLTPAYSHIPSSQHIP
jgi:hypothetical protein